MLMKPRSVLLFIVGIMLLAVWLSFIQYFDGHPLTFSIVGLAIVLLVSMKINNLLFHMVGVLLFACLLLYIQHFKDHPFRFTVVGLAVILLTTNTSGTDPLFANAYKRIKRRMNNMDHDRQERRVRRKGK
ncbi:hypothetical protein [Priestia megaterium]|uniref:hypothetical protein n=1 Tax=Priestia megaterium TaxID=1404 RepID=UPI000BFC39B4|nr:hypothetical protein [Priestia megaterium]PGQ88154.1 hypothetical protein COA18_04320 [Priestia megaterium]